MPLVSEWKGMPIKGKKEQVGHTGKLMAVAEGWGRKGVW